MTLTVLPNGDLIAGGRSGGYVTAARLARLRDATWTSLAVTGYSVKAMAMWPDGKLVVGGDFLSATWAPTCPATAVAYGSGCAGAFGLDVLSALTLPWNNTTLRARATGLPWQSLAFTIYGFAPISVPIATLLPQGLPGCNLLVTPDILGLAAPTAGVLDTEVFLTIAPSTIGVTFYHQVVPLELNGALQVSGITATNGLALTVGWL
ncbi:MAG: hypothetical protein ABIP94_23055 [Planctomycetota bacterium]